MLKNIYSTLTFVALCATASMYTQPRIQVTGTVLGAESIIQSSSMAESQVITMNAYSLAGQSAQIIENASDSAATSLAIWPETSESMVIKPTKAPIATSGAVTEFKVAVEPTIKTADPSPSPVVVKPVITPVPTVQPAALAPHELDALFQKYGSEYGVSWEKLKAIAKCESGFNAAVVSKNGLYGGLFQYVASTWVGTRKQMGLDPNPDLRFNAEEAIRTTAYKISVGGTGPWPHCGKK